MAKAKKAAKKAGKKSAKPAMKKAAKKPAAKKAVAKKPVKKSTAKPAKKAVKPAAKAKNAKPAPKKASAPKAAAKPAAKKSASAPAKVAKKSANLSSFVTPLDDRVLIRLSEMERKTAGGLFIPDTVADVSGNLEGTVVAVGRGHRDGKGRVRPMDVSLGDRVVFAQYAGTKINWDGEDLLILREGELMGIVD